MDDDEYDELRVGDRYVVGDAKVTITAIDGVMAEYAVLEEGSRIPYLARREVPLPRNWTRVGRGPEVLPEPEMCINHPLREREINTLYCPECVDQKAQDWASLTPGHAQATYTALERKAKEHD